MKEFLTDDEYYGDWEYTTNSQLGYVKKSPAYYWMMRNGAKIDGPALRFGNLFHTLVLEPQEYAERFVIFNPEDRPDKLKGMTAKFNKAWKTRLEDDCKEKGKLLMSLEDYELALRLRNKLESNQEIKSMLDASEKEVPKTWIDFNTMSKCKGKCDMIIDGDVIVDIKTTGTDIKDFRRKAYNYGYHRQAAFYLDGFGAKEFIFIVIETKAPHQIGIFRSTEDFLSRGRDEYISLLETKKRYCESNTQATNHIIHEEL